MPESYIQLPADQAGKKIRTRQRTVGGQTVEEQFMAVAALPTFYGYYTPTTSAANKIIAAFWNGSSELVRVRKLFLVQSTAAAVTGVQVQFDLIRRTTTHTGGTAVTFNPVDTADTLPSGITAASGGATAGTASTNMFSYFTNNDENLLGSTTNQTLLQMNSILPEGPEIKEFTVRPNQGFTITHVTSSTIATSWGALCVITTGE